jgi:asparagine synthase (glutamine-hydrolysing)
MCGIAGYVGNEGFTARESIVRAMCDAIVHRGPDDEGILCNGPVGLGMRRLSIIDLSTGHQPIHNEDQSVWIVYNGEVYDYQGLRTDLEQHGHKFYTKTDTECIVHLYEQYGAASVAKLRGMFGYAIYDFREKKLVLARDRFGKKPLHYALHNGVLYYASEIKSILTVAPELAEIDSAALAQYFTFGYIQDPLTAYRNIKKLPPGHMLEFQNGEVKVSQYWDLPGFVPEEARTEDQWLEELETILAKAVKIRMIADVPLGAFLSGGVDSSLVVALMARATSIPVRTFSITFKNGDFDESVYARRVAETFKTDHTEFAVDPDAVEALEKLSAMIDEPFADSSLLPTYFVSAIARKYVTVALSGDGGDELFAGYDRYAIAAQREIFNAIPQPLGKLYQKLIYPALPHSFRGRKFAYNVVMNSRDRFIHGLTYLSTVDRGAGVLADEFLEQLDSHSKPEDAFARIFDQAPAEDLISKLQYLDVKTYLSGDIMVKVDRMSMVTSLETRAPLLDHIFAEHTTRIPAALKLRNGEKKYLLKKLAERVGVPRDVIYRRKQGFAVPLVHWLRNELKPMILDTLFDSKARSRGYFNERPLRMLVDEHMRGYRDHSHIIFMALMVELWHRNYLGNVMRTAETSTSATSLASS